MKINWNVRFKNPHFIFQLLISVIAPVLAYMGISYEDLTTWDMLFDVISRAFSNPYIVGLMIVNVYIALNDPTTTGLSDSQLVMNRNKPKRK